jgi:hypothetical protein
VGQETALVRSIDLRPHTSADGDAWAVLLFGTALFLVAAGFLFVWLRGRMRQAAAVPVRVTHSVPSTPHDAEPIDPYPA